MLWHAHGPERPSVASDRGSPLTMPPLSDRANVGRPYWGFLTRDSKSCTGEVVQKANSIDGNAYFSYLSLQSSRHGAGRKTHNGRPAKATVTGRLRLARRAAAAAQQDPGSSPQPPVRTPRRRTAPTEGRYPAVPDHVREPLGPTTPDQRPTNPAASSGQ